MNIIAESNLDFVTVNIHDHAVIKFDSGHTFESCRMGPLLAYVQLASEWTSRKDLEMQRHHHKLEVLLSDMECRYGIDHPISADIRAAIPKVTEPTFGAVKVIRAKGKSDSPSPFQWKSTQPVSAQ